MATKTLKEISLEFAKKQPQQVEYLTEKAPVLDMMPFEAASHDFWNAYEEITEITAPTVVKMDAPLPNVDVSSDLKKVDLDIFGGKIEKGEDAVSTFGGFPSYVSRKEQHIMRQFGMDAEKRVLYNYLLPFAQSANGVKDKTLFSAGGSSNKNYSIIAVRWEPSVTVGMYNPKGFNQGAMLNYQPINGGNLYTDSNGVLVYGGRWKSYFGVQLASPVTVAACVNIDRSAADSSTWKIPTSYQIDDMLSAIRADSADTYLYMHPDVKNALHKYKDDKLQMAPSDKNFDREVEAWSGVRIITSYNFVKGTESNITVA